jgi:hypothetical protein
MVAMAEGEGNEMSCMKDFFNNQVRIMVLKLKPVIFIYSNIIVGGTTTSEIRS